MDRTLYRVDFSGHEGWAADGYQIVVGYEQTLETVLAMRDCGYRTVRWAICQSGRLTEIFGSVTIGRVE